MLPDEFFQVAGDFLVSPGIEVVVEEEVIAGGEEVVGLEEMDVFQGGCGKVLPEQAVNVGGLVVFVDVQDEDVAGVEFLYFLNYVEKVVGMLAGHFKSGRGVISSG